jgi:DNA recombination protein RmuC
VADPWLLIALAGGLGALLVGLAARGRVIGLRARLVNAEAELAQARDRLEHEQELNLDLQVRAARAEALLEHERQSHEEKLRMLRSAGDELRNAFEAMAAKALRSNNQSFLQIAQVWFERLQAQAAGDLKSHHQAMAAVVDPLQASLERLDRRVVELEQARHEAYGGLAEQVQGLLAAQDQLRREAANLAKALKAPNVRGRWGEIQLRRVVELAGMVNYCDFVEQRSLEGERGRQRPDLVVRLPGGKQIAVDAKVPMEAYLSAADADSEGRRRGALEQHARQVRAHIRDLASKAYWAHFDRAPELVILFLPGEGLLSAALQVDPALIEAGAEQRVILTTPTSLIGVLRAVAAGWQDLRLSEGAQVISALGRELHGRLRHLAEHLAAVGTDLGRAVDSYNRAAGTLESRVLASARRFGELGVGVDTPLPEPASIDRAPRPLDPVPQADAEGRPPTDEAPT